MKKALVHLVDTARGRRCQVMPFTDDFKLHMGAQLTTKLNDTEYLEQNQNNGLQDFKRDTEMLGQVTKGKTDAEVMASIAQFSNQLPLIGERLRDIPGQIFQITTCEQMLSLTIKVDNSAVQNPLWKLTDSRIRYTKNSEGQFFINLCYSVYAYQDTATMKGYCLTDQGKIIQLEADQFTDLTGRDQGKKSEFLNYANQQLHQNLVPIFEIRARIKMKPGEDNAMVYEYVDLTLAINHATISYHPSQIAFEELDSERMFRTDNYHQLEDEDQLSVERNHACQIIPFTPEYRTSFSDYLTQSYKKGAQYFAGKVNQAYPDFQRDVEMLGEITVLKPDAEVAKSITRFCGGDHPQMIEQLSQVAGQAYQIDINGLILQNLKINNLDEEAAFNFQCKDSNIRYSKNAKGEVFLNLHFSSYAYLVSGRRTEGYCVSDQGKLVKFNENVMNKLRGTSKAHFKKVAFEELGINIVPLTAIRARIKLTPSAELNMVTYECVELAISINHSSISYLPAADEDRRISNGIHELDEGHVTVTKNYDELEEQDQAAVQNDMPCQIYRFNEEARKRFSDEHTQYHNFDNQDLEATDMIPRLQSGSLSQDEILSYYKRTNSGHKEFQRGFNILGYDTDGSDDSPQKNSLIDRAIFDYTNGNRVFEHRLRCGPGQSNVAEMSAFLRSNLTILHNGEVFPIATVTDPARKCDYTTSADGKKYLNLSFDYYGIMSGDMAPDLGMRMPDPNKTFALTKEGELVRIDSSELISLKNSNAHVPLFSFRARIELTPTNLAGVEMVRYDFKDLEFSTNHQDIQLSDFALQCIDTQNVKRSADYLELRKLNQSRVEADMPMYFSENPPAIKTIANLTKEEKNRYVPPTVVESPAAGQPLPQPKATSIPAKSTPGFFNIPLVQDSDDEDEFVPVSANPDFETSEQDDGPPLQSGRHVRPRYAAPKEMNPDQFHLLTAFQKSVVRTAHEHSSLRYQSHDANSVTVRDSANPAATTEQYNVKVTGDRDQWRIQSSHLESSTKLTTALIQSNPATMITIVSKRASDADFASIKNDLEALIRLTAQKGTLVDVADHKMDYLKTVNDPNIIQEMKNRFASDEDLNYFMSRVPNDMPLYAFVDEIFRMQNERLYHTTNSLRAGM